MNGTAFRALFPIIRALLGDRQVHGNWFYDQQTLVDAIRAVFMLGREPVSPLPYSLYPADTSQSCAIYPPLVAGDALALVCYEAVLIIVGGEDGAGMVRTRAIWSQDKGDRKRALMDEMRQKIYEVRDGDSVFITYQNLMQFLGIFQNDQEGTQAISAYIELDVVSRLPNITV